MLYSIEELAHLIAPIAKNYKLPAVYLFGSYARCEATENSDVDILIDRSGSLIKSMFSFGALYNDLSNVIKKDIDLITLQVLEQDDTKERSPEFVSMVKNEMVKIF